MMMGGSAWPHATQAFPPGFSCACSVSHKDTSLFSATHSDFFFDLPKPEPAYELPLLRYDAVRDSVRLLVPDACIPDPPPKALTV